MNFFSALALCLTFSTVVCAEADSNQEKETKTMAAKEKIEGNWDKIKGDVRKKWGELTDDDVEKTKGSIEKLKGLLVEKYGKTKEEIDEFFNSLK